MAGTWVAVYVNVLSWTFVGLKLSSSDEYLELDVADNMLISGCH